MLPNGHQFESPQGHWRFTRSLTSRPRGISRGARKLAQTSTVIKKKKKKEKKKEKEGWRRKMGGHINIDGKDDKAIRYGDDSLEDPTSDSDDEA